MKLHQFDDSFILISRSNIKEFSEFAKIADREKRFLDEKTYQYPLIYSSKVITLFKTYIY